MRKTIIIASIASLALALASCSRDEGKQHETAVARVNVVNSVDALVSNSVDSAPSPNSGTKQSPEINYLMEALKSNVTADTAFIKQMSDLYLRNTNSAFTKTQAGRGMDVYLINIIKIRDNITSNSLHYVTMLNQGNSANSQEMMQTAASIKDSYDFYRRCTAIFGNMVRAKGSTNDTYSEALRLIQDSDPAFNESIKPFLELPRSQ